MTGDVGSPGALCTCSGAPTFVHVGRQSTSQATRRPGVCVCGSSRVFDAVLMRKAFPGRPDDRTPGNSGDWRQTGGPRGCRHDHGRGFDVVVHVAGSRVRVFA